MVSVLFWSWLAISLSVYGYRLWRRLSQRNDDTESSSAAATDATSAARGAPAVPPSPSAPPTPSAGPPRSPTDSPVTPTLAAGTPGRAGLFADRRASTESTRVTRVPIADALAGIEMPCGLAPLVGDGDVMSTFRAVFATTEASAEEVGAGLADQLEALGFRLSTISDHEAVATRDSIEVSVTVLADLTAFPTARQGSVVAVLAT